MLCYILAIGMVYCMICSWSNKYLYLLLSSFPTEKIKKEERERKEERKKSLGSGYNKYYRCNNVV